MKTPSQRIYTNVETNEKFRMYVDDTNHSLDLRNEKNGKIITLFYCAAFNGITLKFKDKSILELNAGEFIETDFAKIPTHKKYTGIQKKFTKI